MPPLYHSEIKRIYNYKPTTGQKVICGETSKNSISPAKYNPRVFYNLGLLFIEMGKLQEAKQQFEYVLKLDSTDTDAKHQYELLQDELKIKVSSK
jgi:tetratricopeptide (TPR) repeat protein